MGRQAHGKSPDAGVRGGAGRLLEPDREAVPIELTGLAEPPELDSAAF